MIHLLRDFYINADRFGYTVGILSANNERERENRAKSIILRQSRYYTTLSVAVASTAEIALRDAIAAGDVQTLLEVVQELRCIRDEIIAAVGGKEVEQNG